MQFTKAAAALAWLAFVAAHPGHDIAQEVAERRDFLNSVKRTTLSHCADKLKARGIEARNVARRQAEIAKARQKRGLKKRDFTDVLNTVHNKTGQGFTVDTNPATLFAGYNSCLLTPEVTQGPYYVAGEYVREDLVEDQPGVSLILDYQVIDIETCEPVPNVYLEMWHCNATGVYGGIVASGNGDSTDTSNIDNTWLRGIQPTNEDGVAQFQSIFPGHYVGRTTHIHVMAHTNATLQANKTLGLENYASHVGQVFFDQDLISAVESVAPYSTNQQALTTNEEDGIMAQEAATEGVDPIMEYTLLGDSVEDGIFGWIAFGINTTVSNRITPAVYLYEEGGVANPNAGGGMGGGPPGTGFPTGFPSGIPTGSGSSLPTSLSSESAISSAASSSASSAVTSVATSSGSSLRPGRPGTRPDGKQRPGTQGIAQRPGQQRGN